MAKTYNFLSNEIIKKEFIRNNAPKVKSTDKVKRTYKEDSVLFEFEHKKPLMVLDSLSDLSKLIDVVPTKFELKHKDVNQIFKQQIRTKKIERVLSKSNRQQRIEETFAKYGLSV